MDGAGWAHLLTREAFEHGLREGAGRYVALCGRRIAAASLGRPAHQLLPALPGPGDLDMSTAEPPPAGRRNRVVLPATCSVHQAPRGRTTVAVSKLSDGRIEFEPHGSGGCVFAVEEDELIKALLRWV
ncbi:MAG: hypothetical protein JO281_13235 [Pseudonocardiales bacterium]|nr:hypothetical protein [Pseudonocardiales bacterium]